MTMNVIDIASYQSDMDITKMKTTQGVIVKSTGGYGYTNPSFKKHADQTLKSGKKLGIYHYAHDNGSKGSAQQESKHFIQAIKPYVGKALFVLDFEDDNKSDVKWALDFLNAVYSATGVRPLLYTGLSNENNVNFSSIEKANYGLWVAQYNNYNTVNGFQPREIFGKVKHFKSTAIFQYTSSGVVAGYSKKIDLDVFYGDEKAWDKYAQTSKKPSTPSKPSKPNAPEKFKDDLGVTWTMKKGTFVVGAGGSNLRYGARVTSTLIALIKGGKKISFDADCNAGGYRWIRQPRAFREYGYMAVGTVDKNGQIKEAFGTLK